MSKSSIRRSVGTSADGRLIWELGQTTAAHVNRVRTGEEAMSEDAWIRSQVGRKAILAQSTAIAEAIERAGGTSFRQTTPLVEMDLVTLTERPVPQGFRNNNVIPSVMVSNTRQLRHELDAFVSEHRVSGTTVVLGCDLHRIEALDGVIERMARDSSRIGDHLARKFKVDLFFANTELTARRDAEGTLLFHVHCHLLIAHPWLPLASFTTMVEHIKQRVPAHYARVEPFQAGSSAQSLVRYCITPELFKNVRMTDQEVLGLSEAVHGKKMYRPMGAFKTWRQQFRPVRNKIFVAPHPGDADRFYTDGTGATRERPRRPPVITDIGRGYRKDTLAVLSDARRAARAYETQIGRMAPESRPRILLDAARGLLGANAFNELVRKAVRSHYRSGFISSRRGRRLAIFRAVLALVHAYAIAKPRRRTTKTAEKVVHIKDDDGPGANLRYPASSPKPVRFEPQKLIGSDLVIHHSAAAPRGTRRMSPAILVAFRSDCSPVGLLMKRGLVPQHLRAMSLWNARCSPEERVALAPGLMTKPILIDSHRVGTMVNGGWAATDGPTYRSECIGGKVFIFDVEAENERAARARAGMPKGLMPHIYTTTARTGQTSQKRPPPNSITGQRVRPASSPQSKAA
ncbi:MULTISPECIES: hypothetical protein [Bosea]|jgi:hypothetical protein|nr:hypothetical protein [Bosea vaviloviae]